MNAASGMGGSVNAVSVGACSVKADGVDVCGLNGGSMVAYSVTVSNVEAHCVNGDKWRVVM